ncbi:MAG: hypothetical protein KJO81_01875 [Gammaproteobacteria bacterium]|nr:hypothetical protein [Gammaproteobacteria bacterium]
MNCPSCRHEFNGADIKEKKQKLIAPLFKCPNCESWLQQDAKSAYLKILGLVAWVIGSFGVYGYSPETNKFISYSMFIGGFVVFLVSFKFSKLLMANERSHT